MFDSLIIRVVDDDESIRTTLKEVLEQNGWNCVTYCSAEEMLREDAISVPGCIVLDLKMEGMSGLELQTELNKRGSRLPIIFFSGHGDVDSAVLAMKHGAVNFLRKATGVSELLKLFPLRLVRTARQISYLKITPPENWFPSMKILRLRKKRSHFWSQKGSSTQILPES